MPFAGMILRHVVRAGQRAVLAAEALVVEMLDDAGDGILFVGIHRAGDHARRLEAVVARGRDVLHHRRRARAADEQPDVAPRFVFVEPVERVTGDDARLAAGAAVEVDFEGILLPGPGRRRGQERCDSGRVQCASLAFASSLAVVPAAESFDGRERLLLVEQLRSTRVAARRATLRSTQRSRLRVVRATIGSDDHVRSLITR